MRQAIVFIGIILLITPVWSQDTYRAGLLPVFNFNAKLKKGWKLNSKVEARQRITDGLWGEKADLRFEHERTDISLLASRRVGITTSLAGGYMVRIQGDELIHRFIQQYSWVKKYPGYRLGHRISTDQTLRPETPAQYRFRYRISFNPSLNGEDIDPGEFYLKINHEYLNILQDGQYDLEIRLVPGLGYSFTDNNKLEAGLDYRADAFIREGSRHSFWFFLGWYLSI